MRGLVRCCAQRLSVIVCYAMVLPGRKSGFRAGCRSDNRESLKIGPLAGRRPAGGPIVRLPDGNPAEIRPGNPMSGPEALLRNTGYIKRPLFVIAHRKYWDAGRWFTVFEWAVGGFGGMVRI